MDWKRAAMDDLRRYPFQKQSLENISTRVSALKQKFTTVKGTLSDATPVQGGASRIEDRMLDNIVERERLILTYRATKRLVDLVESGLAGLDDRERLVLERFFITRERAHVERLMEELHVEKTKVYSMKDQALYKFTICMYGLIDY